MNQSCQLNDYILMIINKNGLAYVVENYIMIREDYYRMKES